MDNTGTTYNLCGSLYSPVWKVEALADRHKILILTPATSTNGSLPEFSAADALTVTDVGEILTQLRTGDVGGVYLPTSDKSNRNNVLSLLQSYSILQELTEGVAVVTPDLRVAWANKTFGKWCKADSTGLGFYEALGSPEILGPDYSPFHTALIGNQATTRLHRRNKQYLELHLTPVRDSNEKVTHVIASGRDVTDLVLQQQKLDALHQAGRELTALDADQLAEMTVEDRIELLKLNIRRFTHDLLHYDVVEIRLLDPESGKLAPLLADGMSPEAVSRDLFAKQDDNGVTGFVAATGKSYVCPDTANDPLYIEGSPGARSSLTVALTWADQVIGTFNVESPRLNAFGEQDLQFAEIFSRELATAIHTLELLSAEKRTTASQSIEAVNREVVLPVDDILNAATAVLDRWIGHEPEMTDKLKTILARARQIKECIQKVGEDLAPANATPATTPVPEEAPVLRGMRVLVADSDERVRRSAHSLLGRFGCTVETARDGREAQTMARLSSYDAILADIRLPDVSGYDMFCSLRQVQPHTRVILMTAYGYDPSHSIVKARQEGLTVVLYKPFRVDQLLDALQKPSPPQGNKPVHT